MSATFFFFKVAKLAKMATLAKVVAFAKLAKQTVTITNVMRVALILTFSVDEGCLFKNYG